MQFTYNLQKLEETLYDFYRVTGVSITFYSAEFKALKQKSTKPTRYCSMVGSAKGSDSCFRSTIALLRLCEERREPVRHICDAGLVDIAVPLLYAGSIMGYLMLGQIRREEAFPAVTFAPTLDRSVLESLYRELPCLDEESIESIMHIAVMLTKYILLENMIKPRTNSAAEAVATFIEAHLAEKLTVARIARHVHLSPSGIYKCIHAVYGCTVSSYITARRVERSLSLLSAGEQSVEEIAGLLGFSSAAYFCRCFKKEQGVSPLQYRQMQQGLSHFGMTANKKE